MTTLTEPEPEPVAAAPGRGVAAPDKQDETERPGAACIWTPNPGPQSDAYHSAADILLYGGQGGGGKSDLGLGLAFAGPHRRALVMRRKYVNLGGLIDRAKQIHGGGKGFSGATPPRFRLADRLVEFGANQRLGDEQGWQGIPFDLKVFDEAAQFLEPQVRFHLGWLRSAEPPGGADEQPVRIRALLASNPPLDATGDWIVGFFRPWLDVTHPKPAKHGELRWFVTAPDGSDLEVDGPEPVERGGRKLIPMSRSFIPAALADNPYLVNTSYQAVLDGLPEPLRSAVRDGNFMAARRDSDWQVIPARWVIEAQARWRPDGHGGQRMTAMAFDPAGGGKDGAELCWRHGGWYAPVVTAKGPETADGSAAAVKIIMHRRDRAPVVVDVGGGYGGAVTLRLKDHGIEHLAFNGANSSTRKTIDGGLGFTNKRAEAWWRFREALDPDQRGGSVIALPHDAELRADLTAPCYTVVPMGNASGIRIELKDDIRDRIGRSPGKGDAVVMCLSEGNNAVRRSTWHSGHAELQQTSVRGYQHMKVGRR
jgi:hypothetical protein